MIFRIRRFLIRPSMSYWNSLKIWKKVLLGIGYFFGFIVGLFVINFVALSLLPVLMVSIMAIWIIQGAIKIANKWRWNNPLSFSFESYGDSFADSLDDFSSLGSKDGRKEEPVKEEKKEENLEVSEQLNNETQSEAGQ